MKQLQRLNHIVWECRYHVVWIPKYRKKILYGNLRQESGEFVSRTGESPWLHHLGGALMQGACAYAVVDFTQI